MDPLTITLAVISLATSLKDIIETANAIQDSFSKLPQNYEKAQRLAKSVSKTLREMQEIYPEKQAIFDRTNHLRKTIDDLRTEMKAVHEQCARLVPPASVRKRDRFRIAFYSFWSREKVERLISDLYDHVDRCSQQFLLLSSLETGALVAEIHETIYSVVQNSNNKIAQTSAMLNLQNLQYEGTTGRRDVAKMYSRSPDGFHTMQGASDAHLFAFTRSSPTPMTWMPGTIPEHELSAAYLRRELGKIDVDLLSVSYRWLQGSSPMEADIPDVNTTWSLADTLMPKDIIHQDAVVYAFRLQNLLRETPSDLRINAVDVAMGNLSVSLDKLKMFDDALAMSSLAVDLWRAIRDGTPRIQRRADL